MYKWILRGITRRAGHTTAAAGKSDRAVIVVEPTERQAEDVRRRFGVDAVSLVNAEACLIGNGRPVVFDVETVREIVGCYEGLLDEIKKLIEERQAE